MNEPKNRNELLDLLDALFGGTIAPREHERLERLLAASADARRTYFDYLDLHLQLRQWQKAEAAAGQRDEGQVTRGEGSGIGDLGTWGLGNLEMDSASPLPPSALRPLLPSLSPLPSPLSPPFVGGPVFSYLVATLILGMMLLGAWAYKISHYQQFVRGPSAPSDTRQELVFVGQITGMVDCRWSDPRTETIVGAYVPLNRRYALAAGLMEITYDSGAKVILEGPCNYEVESCTGGYLAVGRLTARIGERGERRGESKRMKDEGRRMKLAAVVKPRAANPKSPNLQISKSPNHYPLSTIHYPLFTVRTPTAVVTDLGTEFGVEVSKEGDTTSHVFRGSVNVRVIGDDGPLKEMVLRANESARVEKGLPGDNPRLVLPGKGDAPPKFVRRLFEPPRELDLLDVVAGGNGTGKKRERGIDPVTGWEDPLFVSRSRAGDGRYRTVEWHRLIDGVFVPDGGDGAVQLDSAGHKFDAFSDTAGRTSGSIWARAAEVKTDVRVEDLWNWVYFMGAGEQFMPKRRGLLALHANSGITFDLAEMRRRHGDVRPGRFSATAGMADASRKTSAGAGLADLWIFVDGRLKLKREKIRPQDGAFNVEVELGPNDRFLTIASTDGGDGITSDWLVLGDPLLDMTSTD